MSRDRRRRARDGVVGPEKNYFGLIKPWASFGPEPKVHRVTRLLGINRRNPNGGLVWRNMLTGDCNA